MRFLIILAAIAGLSLPAEAQRNTARMNGTADYALINGFVYTMDPSNPTAGAIAVEGNVITYVGAADGLGSVIGLGTQVIDLDGKMVLPGFVDGHIHPIAGGIISRGVDLQTDDREILFERIRQEVAENDNDVILGYGVRFNLWTDGNPTAAMLDAIEADRPLFFFTIDGHGAWVNSKAMERAGIDRDSPDTVPGFSFFERDANGDPTGWIIEVPAAMQVLNALIDVDLDYVAEGVETWLPRFSAAGITTAHDLGVQGIGQAEGFDLISGYEVEGQLPLRVQGVYYWNDPAIDPVPILREMRQTYSSELLRAQYLKINLDGGDDKWNALYVEPYSDRPEVVPQPIIPYDVLNDVVRRADAEGINVTCHCFGDLAVRKLLDAVEAAIAANPDRDRRHAISHATLVHPHDYARFGELGVTYDSSGAWMTLDPLLQSVTTTRLGADRVSIMFPMKAIADAGGNVSLGSDWPASGYVSEYRPLASIQAAVTRQLPGREEVPPLGGEDARLPLDLALRAHTINAAYGMDMDDQVGSLEVGKLADLVVLERNLFEVDPYEIGQVKVLYTVMNGELVYEAE